MPTTPENIDRILTSPDFDASDKWTVEWQFRLLGHFQTALAQAITLADEENLERLARGFPAAVEGYLRWTRGDLAKRLKEAGMGV